MENFKPNLNARTVTIIGQGNVAIDVSRILLSPIDALAKTDITHFALQALSESKVEKVNLVGRRGPLQAAFTIKELREMTKLHGVNIVWRGEDFIGIKEELPNLTRPRNRLTELMLSNLSQQQHEGNKLFTPIFFRSPQLIDSSNNLVLSINKLVGERAEATTATEMLECDLIMRSIGYKSICLDKELNFNEKEGYVNNVGGRSIITYSYFVYYFTYEFTFVRLWKCDNIFNKAGECSMLYIAHLTKSNRIAPLTESQPSLSEMFSGPPKHLNLNFF